MIQNEVFSDLALFCKHFGLIFGHCWQKMAKLVRIFIFFQNPASDLDSAMPNCRT